MKPVTQYRTAVFELRPSESKAAALERVRSGAEGIREDLARDGAARFCQRTIRSLAISEAAKNYMREHT